MLHWEHIYANWEDRNRALHGYDANSREAALLLLAQKETENLYEIRDQVLSRDKDLFYTTIDTHYKQEPTSRGLRQWLNTWKPVLLHSLEESKKRGLQGVRALTHYFQRTIITNPTPADVS